VKNLILVLVLALTTSISFATEAKKVCIDQKDTKTGKIKQVCKEVKQHVKLEGTKVPDKK